MSHATQPDTSSGIGLYNALANLVGTTIPDLYNTISMGFKATSESTTISSADDVKKALAERVTALGKLILEAKRSEKLAKEKCEQVIREVVKVETQAKLKNETAWLELYKLSEKMHSFSFEVFRNISSSSACSSALISIAAESKEFKEKTTKAGAEAAQKSTEEAYNYRKQIAEEIIKRVNAVNSTIQAFYVAPRGETERKRTAPAAHLLCKKLTTRNSERTEDERVGNSSEFTKPKDRRSDSASLLSVDEEEEGLAVVSKVPEVNTYNIDPTFAYAQVNAQALETFVHFQKTKLLEDSTTKAWREKTRDRTVLEEELRFLQDTKESLRKFSAPATQMKSEQVKLEQVKFESMPTEEPGEENHELLPEITSDTDDALHED